MRIVLRAAVLACVCVAPALGQQPASPVTSSAPVKPPAQSNANPNCSGTWSAKPETERARTTFQAYTAKCGNGIVSAAPAQPPASCNGAASSCSSSGAKKPQ